jgi:hypothetical protein
VAARPEQPDHGEAEGEPADLGKGVSELLAGLQVVHVGHLQIDDQQGDGDGEDGVAEVQDPVVLELPGSGQDTPASGGDGHGRECTHPAGAPRPAELLPVSVWPPPQSDIMFREHWFG